MLEIGYASAETFYTRSRIFYSNNQHTHTKKPGVAPQSVRSMKLSLAAYSTENSAAVGAWVCWSRTTQSRPGVYSRMGRTEQQLGGSEEDGQDRQSIAG